MDNAKIVAVAPNLPLSSIKDLKRADLLELHLNLIQEEPQKFPFPLLITARDPKEGGKGHLSLQERKKLIEKWLPFASYVDIEICNLSQSEDLLEKAENLGVKVVASFHDFSSTPSLNFLQDKVDEAIEAGTDIVKIATLVNSLKDLGVLEDLLFGEEFPLSISPMGDFGGKHRVEFAKLGSVLNYGYLDKPNASGQPPVSYYVESLISDVSDSSKVLAEA